jgi:hypothetical protein
MNKKAIIAMRIMAGRTIPVSEDAVRMEADIEIKNRNNDRSRQI